MLAFAVVLGTGARTVGAAFARTTLSAVWARRITGLVFVGVGLYLSLLYVYEL